MLRFVGWAVMLWATVFLYVMTRHFGKNLFPETMEEWLCDITGIGIFLAGLFIRKQGKNVQKELEEEKNINFNGWTKKDSPDR